MAKIFVTRTIPEVGLEILRARGYEVVVNSKDSILKKEELIAQLRSGHYDAVLCLLTDTIGADVIEAAAPTVKIFANFAVGFDNIDVAAAKEKGIMVTNTPDVLTDTVAEHTFALMLATAHRVAEADAFVRSGKYEGWAPMLLLGNDVSRKTLGVIGLGRIGSRVAHHAVHGFDMKVVYHDVKQNEEFEKTYGATYAATIEELLKISDFVTLHVPLLPQTRHLINTERLAMMKPCAYLVNTSRGAIIDEAALIAALRDNVIKGAALDVFEFEPTVSKELLALNNVVLTPHIASATEETRDKMAELAARNIIEVLEGKVPPNMVQ